MPQPTTVLRQICALIYMLFSAMISRRKAVEGVAEDK